MFPKPHGAGLARIASAAHKYLAGLAVIAVAALWLIDWKRGVAPMHPEVALLVAAILVLGCMLGRTALRRTERVGGSEEVMATLLAAYGRDGNKGFEPSDLVDVPQGTPAMVPLQIIVAAATALAFVVMILWPGPSTTPPAPIGEWGIWPTIAAIALSELMYVGWMFEGEAIADELILFSRRRARRLEFGPPQPGTPADATLRHARHLNDLLARHGVVLVPPR